MWLEVVILTAFTVRVAAQSPDTFNLTVPKNPISTHHGSVILPCETSPLFDVAPFEFRWFRPEKPGTPVLWYKESQLQQSSVDPRYQGRVSLSGGLERGDVSLRLERVTLEDRGEYVCHVISDKWYDRAKMHLKVISVTGSVPVLCVAEGGGGQVNATCQSEGWSPQPTLTWRNKAGTQIRSTNTLNSVGPQGLVSVSSWLLYSPLDSDWLSCTVSLSEEDKTDGRIFLGVPKTSLGAWKEAFIVTLALSLLIISILSALLCRQKGSMLPLFLPKSHKPEINTSHEGEEESTPLKQSVEEGGAEGYPNTTSTVVFTTAPTTAPIIASTIAPTIAPTASPTPAATHAPNACSLSSGEGGSVNTKEAPAEPEQTVLLDEDHPHPGKATPDDSIHELTDGLKGLSTSDAPSRASGDELLRTEGRKPEPEVAVFYKAKAFKAEITLEPQSIVHPDLAVSPDGTEVYSESGRPNKEPRLAPHVLSEEEFNSGQHYWEVTYQSGTYSTRESWYVGVVTNTATVEVVVPLTPQNGFWVLHYETNKGIYVPNDPSKKISTDALSTVGILLDCNKQTLSFYDVDSKSLCYTFENVKSNNSFHAVFSPGRGKITVSR